jgi:hypothetical protein
VYPQETGVATATKIAFGTPHGILEMLTLADLRQAGVEEKQLLTSFEIMTTESKRTLYGGDVALQELLKRKPARK